MLIQFEETFQSRKEATPGSWRCRQAENLDTAHVWTRGRGAAGGHTLCVNVQNAAVFVSSSG